MERAYLTFSRDYSCAFVEYGPLASSPERAIGRLRELGDDYPEIAWSDPDRARVVSREHWDEWTGVRYETPNDRTRTLWRIDVAHAVDIEASLSESSHKPWDVLEPLLQEGRVDEQVVQRLHVLQPTLEQADRDLADRQAARPDDGPRALFAEGHGAVLARAMELVLGALRDASGDAQFRHAVDSSLDPMRQKLQEEEDRQVSEFRSELGWNEDDV
jgi:hypothetical protein